MKAVFTVILFLVTTAVGAQEYPARPVNIIVPVPVGKANPGSLGMLLKAEVDKWGPIIRKTGVFAD